MAKAKPIPLSEMIAAVGDDRVIFQNLFEDTVRATVPVEGVTELTFRTSIVTPGEFATGEPAMVGLVVWLPRDELQQVLARRRRVVKRRKGVRKR